MSLETQDQFHTNTLLPFPGATARPGRQFEPSALSTTGIIEGALFLTKDDAKRSMGKILVAMVTLVLSTGSCYMFDKKKSVTHLDLMPLHVSRLCQIAARIIALALFFSVQRDFAAWFPALLAQTSKNSF